jgi:flagellin
MSLRVHTNVNAIAARTALSKSERQMQDSLKELATGKRTHAINKSASDFTVGESLRAQVKSFEAAKRNSENAISVTALAEGALNEQTNILIRLRELAIQASSDTTSDKERELIDTEFQQLAQEFDRVAQTTRFGSHELLTGQSYNFEFQVGANSGEENIIRFQGRADARARAFGVDSMDVTTKSRARSSLSQLDEAIAELGVIRSKFGALHNRLQHATDVSAAHIENLSAAYSRLTDTDYAEAMSEFTRNRAIAQYQIAALRQANEGPLNAINLIA